MLHSLIHCLLLLLLLLLLWKLSEVDLVFERTATRFAVYATKGDISQRRKSRELPGGLNHSPIDVFNAPFLLRYIV